LKLLFIYQTSINEFISRSLGTSCRRIQTCISIDRS